MIEARTPMLGMSHVAVTGGRPALGRRAPIGLLAVVIALVLQGTLAGAASAESTVCSAGVCTTTFSSTGALQTWKIPASVTEITLTVKGAGGGAGSTNAGPSPAGGAGGEATGTFGVTPGMTLDVVVGTGGAAARMGGDSAAYGGGGRTGIGGFLFSGAGGGGGSFVFAPSELLIAAGGGGGAGAAEATGGAGGQTATAGASASSQGEPVTVAGGAGATDAGAGSGGPNAGTGTGKASSDTSVGVGGGGGGGAEYVYGGGGGGGGYYGGGGGGAEDEGPGEDLAAGGGGGSDYVSADATVTSDVVGGGGTGGTEDGAGGSGGVVITYKQVFVAPTVTTGEATSPTETTIKLAGTVNPNGSEVTSCEFEYGTTTSYGSEAPCSPAPGAGSEAVSVSASLSGLEAGTTYDYRVVAKNAGGETDGATKTFKTVAAIPAPTVKTGAASAVTQTTATLEGTVDPNGYEVTSCEFEYGTTTAYVEKPVPCSAAPGAGTGDVSVSASLTGLKPATTYDYRLVATNAGGTKDSNGSFKTTATAAPTVTALPPSSVTETTATLNGTVNPNGSAVTECEFAYGTSSSALNEEAPCAQSPGAGSAAVAVSAAITKLVAGKTYYYRLEAKNGVGHTVGSEIMSFEARKVPPPTVTVPSASAITQTTAELSATVNPNGNEVTSCEFEYATSSAALEKAPSELACSPGKGTAAVPVSVTVTGLAPGRTYYFKLVVKNASTEVSEPGASFTTEKAPEEVKKEVTNTETTTTTSTSSTASNGTGSTTSVTSTSSTSTSAVTTSTIATPVLTLLTKEPLVLSAKVTSLALKAKCGAARCALAGTATVKVPGYKGTWHLRTAIVNIPAGGSGKLSVALPAALRKALRGYLRHHRRFNMKLDVAVTQLVGGHVVHVDVLAVSLRA
jgi:phosphodiesterase/alkaline phosphatase D-like protein